METGMADTRIFRITSRYGKVDYGSRRRLSGKFGNPGYYNGPVAKVEATNAEATEGWADVTSEFLGGDR